MFKKQPSDNQIILITAALVAVLAVPTFKSLMNEDLASLEAVKSSQTIQSSRNPASVAPVADHQKLLVSSPLKNLDLNCNEKKEIQMQMAGSHIQLKGKYCLKNFKAEDVEIQNKTNGFTATFFIHGSNNYQTDLIQLQKGENEILIRYKQNSGKSVEEVLKVHSTTL